MRILAFDTTNATLSVALLDNDQLLAKHTITDGAKQSEILIPEIEKILTQHNLWYHNLDAIAATSGPGSFTGVRVGLSTARTLKIATQLPLLLVESLEVLAFKYANQPEEVFVAIDARMDEFFIAHFNQHGKQILPSQLIKSDDITKILPKNKFLLCGSGKDMVKELINDTLPYVISDDDDIIEADLVGILAYQKMTTDDIKDDDHAVYLRNARISKRKK